MHNRRNIFTQAISVRVLSLLGSAFLASTLNAQNVVTDWNTIAATTIVTNGGMPPGASGVWLAYSSLAIYDAVNKITGEYRPFYSESSRLPDASVDAAVAAAAHRILVYYFPAQQAALDAQLVTSLTQVNAPERAKTRGVAVGEAAALAVISARVNDGLEANVPYAPGSGPGAWIPTYPGYLSAATPWLGQMRPFTMKTASEFLPDGPTPLDSEPWARDYNLTRLYGAANSSLRSAAETEIGLFYTENTAGQYARMFNYLIENYHLATADSARLVAVLWTGYADAAIGCFNGKYRYGFWRPVTAIPVGGGEPQELTADPGWLPLGTTPNHPEYPAAHGCLTGAVTTLIADYFGTTKVNVVVDSKAFTTVHTHTFADTRDLMDEVFWARIYAGFHFYHSLEDGRQLGQSVAKQLFHNYFRPESERER